MEMSSAGNNQQNGMNKRCLTNVRESENSNHWGLNYIAQSPEPSSNNNITTRRRPNPIINRYPERDQLPARSNIEDSIRFISKKKKIRIITDSIPKGIRTREFNSHLKYGDARFRVFPGSTTSTLGHYSIPTLIEENPEIVLIHVGINDILNMERKNVSEIEIAKNIVNIVNEYKKYGVEKVLVSGITVCTRVDPKKISIVNEILK